MALSSILFAVGLLGPAAIANRPNRPGARVWAPLSHAPVRADRHEGAFFVDSQTGWLVNGYGRVFKTPNSGATWQLQKTLDSFLRSVGFADARTGWVGTLDPRHPLYATADGGKTWRDASKPSGPRPAGICGLCVSSVAR